MGSRISSKAKDNHNGSNKRLLGGEYNLNVYNDQVSQHEEENDEEIEDVVKIEVEEQQEEGKIKGLHGGTDATQGTLAGPHAGTDATPGDEQKKPKRQVRLPKTLNKKKVKRSVLPLETMSSGETSAAAETTSSGATRAAKGTQTSGATSAAAETTSSGATSAEKGGPPTKSCRRKFGVVALFFLLIGCVSIGFYFYCYIGDKEHYLRFFGHMSYRPSLVLAPLIVFLAACKTPEKPYTSWENVFVLNSLSRKTKREAYKNNKCTTILSTGLIYILVPGAVCGFKITFFFTTPTQCGGAFLPWWLIFEILGVLFFAPFCYFLYWQRLVVQEARKKASKVFRENVGKLECCRKEINNFFKEYHPLRSLMLPLMYIFLFESTFGIVIFLTWNYKDVDPSNGTLSPTVQPYWPIRTFVCPVNCPPVDFNHLKSSMFYNLWIVSRHIMTILLPYWSVSGMDMKYIWDDLRTELFFSYSGKHESLRHKLTVYMQELHPDTSTYTVLNIIVPLMALAAGIFTVDQL